MRLYSSSLAVVSLSINRVASQDPQRRRGSKYWNVVVLAWPCIKETKPQEQNCPRTCMIYVVETYKNHITRLRSERLCSWTGSMKWAPRRSLYWPGAPSWSVYLSMRQRAFLAHTYLELYASPGAETSSIRRGMLWSMWEKHARRKWICRIRDIVKTLIEKKTDLSVTEKLPTSSPLLPNYS